MASGCWPGEPETVELARANPTLAAARSQDLSGKRGASVRRPVSGAVRRRRADVLARRRQQQARSARDRILTTAEYGPPDHPVRTMAVEQRRWVNATTETLLRWAEQFLAAFDRVIDER
jgi:hypothetical protein